MSLPTVLFYVFAALTVGSALALLWTKNVFYAAFSLLLTFLGAAALYALAGADFVAVVQIMIYVGGVLLLLIFGVMLTAPSAQAYVRTPRYQRWFGMLIGIGLFGVLTIIIHRADFASIPWIADAQRKAVATGNSTVPQIGKLLMTDVVLPFELAGILLLVALVGAAHIAGRKVKE